MERWESEMSEKVEARTWGALTTIVLLAVLIVIGGRGNRLNFNSPAPSDASTTTVQTAVPEAPSVAPVVHSSVVTHKPAVTHQPTKPARTTPRATPVLPPTTEPAPLPGGLTTGMQPDGTCIHCGPGDNACRAPGDCGYGDNANCRVIVINPEACGKRNDDH